MIIIHSNKLCSKEGTSKQCCVYTSFLRLIGSQNRKFYGKFCLQMSISNAKLKSDQRMLKTKKHLKQRRNYVINHTSILRCCKFQVLCYSNFFTFWQFLLLIFEILQFWYNIQVSTSQELYPFYPKSLLVHSCALLKFIFHTLGLAQFSKLYSRNSNFTLCCLPKI